MEIKRWIDHENYVTKKEDKEIIHPELKTSKKLKMINNGKVSQWILIFLMPLNSSLLTLSSYDKGIIWRQSKIPYLFLLESNHVTTLRLQILLYKTSIIQYIFSCKKQKSLRFLFWFANAKRGSRKRMCFINNKSFTFKYLNNWNA